jgi:hypothetical protein
VLVAILDEAIGACDARRLRTWQATDRVAAKALRAVLVKLRAEAGDAKTAASLAGVRDRARQRLGQVDRLRRKVQAQQQAVQDARQQQALESRHAVEDRRRAERQQRRGGASPGRRDVGGSAGGQRVATAGRCRTSVG